MDLIVRGELLVTLLKQLDDSFLAGREARWPAKSIEHLANVGRESFELALNAGLLANALEQTTRGSAEVHIGADLVDRSVRDGLQAFKGRDARAREQNLLPVHDLNRSPMRLA
ncbi:MAG TPA: hypothetical protein VHF22_07070 [Planctomycetota bacterium]|nr:hypothetical protein [Planctomycetota bacterium]